MDYPVETQISSLTTVRRERLLPARGQVLVRAGERVEPDDVVAHCLLPGEIQVVDVSRALRIRRERVAPFIRKAAGDPVRAGEVLAAQQGMLARLKPSCRAPTDGHIVAVRDGRILIEVPAIPFELQAGLPGTVTNIMPGLGVVIATSGALIQGFWGNGREAGGVLKVVADNPQRSLRARSIDVSCQGTLIVGGRIADEEALKQAVDVKVRGIIVGSVHAELCPLLLSLPFPVLITEGFGSLPMSQAAFSLLQTHIGREALLDAAFQTRWGIRRPEVLIPLPDKGEPTREKSEPSSLQVGAQVRILRAPYRGVMGTVVDLPSAPHIVESGLRLPVAVVDPGEGEPIIVPRVNLELISPR